jgi:hypothetical protein
MRYFRTKLVCNLFGTFYGNGKKYKTFNKDRTLIININLINNQLQYFFYLRISHRKIGFSKEA